MSAAAAHRALLQRLYPWCMPICFRWHASEGGVEHEGRQKNFVAMLARNNRHLRRCLWHPDSHQLRPKAS